MSSFSNAEEMVCSGYRHDKLGMYAVFYSVPDEHDPTKGKTLFLSIRHEEEFPIGTHVIVDQSYTDVQVRNMSGELVKRVIL